MIIRLIRVWYLKLFSELKIITDGQSLSRKEREMKNDMMRLSDT